MNRHYLLLLLSMSFMLPLSLSAQRAKTAAYAREASAITAKYKKEIQQKGRELTILPTDSDTLALSPYFYRLLGPGVYYRPALARRFRLDYGQPSAVPLLPTTELLEERRQLNASIDKVLSELYATRPAAFHYSDAQIASEQVVATATGAGARTEDLSNIYRKATEITDVAEVVGDVDVDLQIKRPNFWTTQGKFSLQFTQNYFSENWYKGGNNNVTLLSNLVLEANYNDQRRVQWDNKLDLRLGFVTATSDSIHRYLTNNDKIYLFSKLGIKAAKNWFYTASLEANTQFLPSHKSNDRRTYAKFLAPLDVYFSIGMDWKPKFKNGNTFSLALLPLSYKMRYIGDDEPTIHSSYKMPDKDFQQDFGSKIEFNSKITIVKNLTWRCRCYYFTSYKYCESEMENVFSFQFNKYISSEVYTLWRFDDNRGKQYYDDTLGFFQFKEYFTLGLAYNF